MTKQRQRQINLSDIRSNRIQRCAQCGISITPDNDSGWEVFVGDSRLTQSVCAWCEVENSDGGEKEISNEAKA